MGPHLISGRGATTLLSRLLTFRRSNLTTSNHNKVPFGGYLSINQRKKMKRQLRDLGYATADIREHGSLRWSVLSNPETNPPHGKMALHEGVLFDQAEYFVCTIYRYELSTCVTLQHRVQRILFQPIYNRDTSDDEIEYILATHCSDNKFRFWVNEKNTKSILKKLCFKFLGYSS